MAYMIKSTIFAVIFSHGFVLLPYSPVTVIMAFTCIYDSSSFSFGITNLALLETNNVVLILVFHINPPDTIIKYGKNEKLTFFLRKINFYCSSSASVDPSSSRFSEVALSILGISDEFSPSNQDNR